jgi:transposase InsO family protein
MAKWQGQFSLAALCRTLGLSRSGYYAWKQRPASARKQANAVLTEAIKSAFVANRESYGSPRLCTELQEQGYACSEKRVARLMRESSLKAVVPRRFVVTTDSNHALPVAENLLNRQFTVETPNQRWVSDISYVWTREGWLYLAVVLDLFSRRVVGWSMDSRLNRSLVLAAWDMATSGRCPESGLLCHSDRGSQYASDDYQQALQAVGAVCSMSRKGNCWDNAPVESFFGSLKRELVHRVRFTTRQEARSAIFDWIEVWYNRQRRHSSLGNQSPERFERLYWQQREQGKGERQPVMAC